MSATAPHPASRWQSIDRRLPLLITLLLIVAIAALAAGAYRAVEGTLVDAAEARLEASVRQLGSLLSESAAQRQGEVAATAADPALRTYLADPGPATREAAIAALSGPLDESQTMAAELWSAAGRLVLATHPEAQPAATATIGRRPPVGPGLTTIRVEQGVAFYGMAAPVAGVAQGGEPAGWVVVRRNLSSAGAAELLSGLIGPEARLLLGNSDGGAWTDLIAPAPPPFEERSVEPGTGPVMVDGEPHLGAAKAVPGTPWLVWVDLPRESALRPAHDFLRRLSGMAFVLLVAGAVVTYGLSRHVTKPLDQLTDAAEGLAGGELNRKVPVQRRDEVGRLARAFDRMRHQVADSQHRLEHRVEERTRELREALARLHETQEELVRQERLAILGQLASGVGHELRNPLAVMTNAIFYLEMVLEDATPEVREYLGILHHQVELSEKIVSDLLDFARIKAPQREELRLPDLVEQQLERIELTNDTRVECDFSSHLPMAVGDPVQVGQVVLNLLVNAVQAMDESGGALTLRARAAGPDAVELEVRDSGPGIPSNLRGQIFEPLFTTKARGIGLGLAVSRRLAEANDGYLSLDEAAGPGAAFVLRLPRVPEAGP